MALAANFNLQLRIIVKFKMLVTSVILVQTKAITVRRRRPEIAPRLGNDFIVLSDHIKEAQSIQDLVDTFMDEAKEYCWKDNLGQEAIKDAIFTYVVDFSQNMEKSYFG